MKRIFKFLMSLALLSGAIYILDWNSLKTTLQKISPWVFILAILMSLVQYLVLAVRWQKIIHKIAPLPFQKQLTAYFYGTFLNTFTPANLGGDAYRLLYLRPYISHPLHVVIALIQERLLGLLSYLLGYLLCLTGLWFTQLETFLTTGYLFMVTGGVILGGVIGIFLSPLILHKILSLLPIQTKKGLARTLRKIYYATHFKPFSHFLVLMGLSFMALFLWILTVQTLAISLHIQTSFWAIGAVVILVELIRIVPISIQGIGVREATFAYLFSILGGSPEAGFVLGAVSYLSLSFSLLLSGVVGSTFSVL